ncbi:tetratricopeptide (TPR) repeat protein [Parabacteroides sp. PF5-5]|uniref:tetratricopeptide repeat protein n=1 Tax=unclassified Parabacteroides TaxID=2649774 RepID=UPI0024745D4E|nr:MULTISPECIES: tetratricopeptide repeat protein [unclassified Parabacteroides]MDH6303967.1 tetratricopeptide (TPR) repeat protein [Parabacteroides sp. PH5-39]MDH6314583.1 tetratricopeptide (TPR) repeat protein [Parabacteroides sp. PF5-13]MDH6318352.1 tetratricopeptide (TPR) repeat protein [Parabacteroides sp. PH5-13]MDH6322356.1 tetratricopeptide (TPR) repeat protein [Parabacteroides sp. PH5-8]MDH6325565.1 tetratricopeptide (TPR) repeat protein [Parabacteroides sp. PH5-41]
MATKEKSKELEVGEIVSRSEQFLEKHQKNIIYGIIAVILVVGAVLGIRHGYLIPKEKKAAAALFKGEQYFAKDSFALALNGNGADYIGFESIMDDFGSTKSGNLAKAYAGVCYFKLGENDKAMKLLKSFNGKDNMISPALTGLIGDCYVNAGNIKEGINYFEKAAKAANNPVISPLYLKKAGVAYEELKQYKDAEKAYTSIKEKYNNSMEASDIDKYITRASELANK